MFYTYYGSLDSVYLVSEEISNFNTELFRTVDWLIRGGKMQQFVNSLP